MKFYESSFLKLLNRDHRSYILINKCEEIHDWRLNHEKPEVNIFAAHSPVRLKIPARCTSVRSLCPPATSHGLAGPLSRDSFLAYIFPWEMWTSGTRGKERRIDIDINHDPLETYEDDYLSQGNIKVYRIFT